jgi:murein DD-endopeptidase MepM/ murein hydrolase activator NlpD
MTIRRKSFAVASAALLCAAVASRVLADVEVAAKYPSNYSAAQQFCPPTDGFFEEVQRTVDRVGTHTFRHQPNGGYGLPVVDKVGDANLLHLGADVGFYRVGEPVYAVATGVVRMSQGENEMRVALQKAEGGGGMAGGSAGRSKKEPSPGLSQKGRGKTLEWGNVVVIEHHLPDGQYVTTIYGHLANDLLVKRGAIVQAGQQIGTIGSTRVNGGYKPHLHLGVRAGRMAEVGRKLLLMTTDGHATQMQITALEDDKIELSGATSLPAELVMGLDGRKIAIDKHDDKATLDAAFLYYVPSPEFQIVGYGLSTDGWLDPIDFLRQHGAEANPADFRRAQRGSGVQNTKSVRSR